MVPRLPALLATAAVGAAAALTGGAPPASAAANPYTAAQVCGAGYKVYVRRPVNFGTKVYGSLVLLHNAGAGKYCAVTRKTTFVGTPIWTDVSLRNERRKPQYVSDGKFYSYYAGPVYLPGKLGSCVHVMSSMQIPAKGTTLVAGSQEHFGC
ncbi:hypothetical protein [Patulibacter sp. SYSU D01012]|uniref:hypothetical protein n=1 Tax=Patulibacter sp. SYSU D01012 TaxID=2817381 RepID=UPI001B30289D|nr:hypothetical protein [Patulibacter sp. SYSU D01012]